ncbi:cysteine-rich PDZ-binding protein isoform X1 [Vanacampus margaritifer]
MVCEKCEKKLGRVITPDTWKDGARNTIESGGRKRNENKLLTSKKARFDPYSKTGFAKCRICKSSVHQSGSHYCQGCAYKKGWNLRHVRKEGYRHHQLQADVGVTDHAECQTFVISSPQGPLKPHLNTLLECKSHNTVI